VSVTASPIILEGKPRGAIIIFRDITLEYEIDRMKSDFISLASHQLRTPLSSINMYSQMLYAGYMGEVSDKQRAPLRTIIESAERMSQLINTLLNITRIENGTIVVSHKRVDLNDLSEEIVEELRIEAENKDLNLMFKPSTNLPLVRTDRLIMKEILTNLISNAIKYTPRSGSVIVSVRSLKQKVEFRVADTGVGIPNYSKDNIFSKFFRAPNVMRGETTGTGLGLYLVKGMAERLGAEVWFDSELGKGSTFYLTLPTIGS
jgi:signal transduction histidine kinase